MALQNLKTDLIRVLYSKDTYDEVSDAVGASMVHRLSIPLKENARLASKATRFAIIAKLNDKDVSTVLINNNKDAFGVKLWEGYWKQVADRWNKNTDIAGIRVQAGPVTGCYRLRKGVSAGHIVFVISGGTQGKFSDVNYKVLYKYLTREVYKIWKSNHKDLAKNVAEGKSSKPDQTQGGSRTTHTDHSAYEAYMLLKAEEFAQEARLFIEDFDLPQALIDALEVEWKENTNLKKWNYRQTRIANIRLMEKDIALPLDKKYGYKFLNVIDKVFDSADYWNLDSEVSTRVNASIPFKEQAAAAIQYDIMREAIWKAKKAGLKVKTPKLVKPKSQSRKGNLKKARKTPFKSSKITIPQKITVAKLAGKETGEGKQASTDAAMSLVALKGKINRRLGAEVRRNMGGTRLNNRTGIFSNSAKLLNLRHTKKGISGEYTYMLTGGGKSKGSRRGVYSTFENAGRWRTSYNPKPLISKSIQNLALQIAETRFVSLRRT